MWLFANRNSLPVLSHTYYGGDRLEVFDHLAQRYPNVTILLGHAGMDLGLENSIQLVRRRKNIVLDLTGPLLWEGVVEHLVDKVAVEQLIFGSDLPFNNAALQLGGLVYSRAHRSDIEMISSGNAMRIFGINH